MRRAWFSLLSLLNKRHVRARGAENHPANPVRIHHRPPLGVVAHSRLYVIERTLFVVWCALKNGKFAPLLRTVAERTTRKSDVVSHLE